MKFFKDWLSKAEQFLEPQQGFVTALLIVVIAVSAYLLFSKNALARTTWAAWMILP